MNFIKDIIEGNLLKIGLWYFRFKLGDRAVDAILAAVREVNARQWQAGAKTLEKAWEYLYEAYPGIDKVIKKRWVEYLMLLLINMLDEKYI